MPTEQHSPPAGGPPADPITFTAGPDLLRRLLERAVIHPEDWDALAPIERQRLEATADGEALLTDLVAAKLLTPYQVGRIATGTADELVLGNYRLLARFGVGGRGTVYQAEHLLLRRPVALKLLAGPPAPRALRGLWARARAVARLQHPHLVAALDVGEAPGPQPYLVTELVPGQNLANLVQSSGPLDLTRAGLLTYQIADALAEAHRQGLVHRDLKPANVVVTPDGQAKLLNFGLMLEPDPACPYRAPELADDPAGGDERADLFSLGGLLFWCLTGREPFPTRSGNGPLAAARRPPVLTEHRPDLPRDLDAVLARLLAAPAERYPTATAVMRALRPFLPADEADWYFTRPTPPRDHPAPVAVVAAEPANRVLIVDDTDELRHFCRAILTAEGLHCVEAATGQAALALFQSQTVDLVLLDLQLPDHTGMEILQKMRQAPRCANLKVIVCSGAVSPDEMAQLLLAGADFYLTKPFSLVQLQSCVRAVLRLKDAQDRADLLTNRLLSANSELEFALRGRDVDLLKARNALVLALAKLVEQRSTETGAHLLRLQRFCRVLAEAAAEAPSLSGQLDAAFIDLLEVSVPLHDIGKVTLPDYILNKPGKLDPDERRLMQAHTIIGAETLADVARQHGFALPFMQMAIDIARHHHERWDGTGYPDRLAGTAIPLAARLTAITDVYDALRARRVYKPALSHATVVHTMTEGSPGHFDPVLLQAFQRCAPQFERIFRELVD